MGNCSSKRPDADDIKRNVRERYGKRAETPAPCCAPAEKIEALERLGYNGEEVAELPGSVTCRSAGCGSPVTFAEVTEGECVLDLGAGSGIDVFLAAKRAGSTGKVIWLDMTPEVLARANENKRKLGADNVEFRRGEMEDMPVDDESVDAVISNCVICLSPDKGKVFQEAFRVLKPGGRLVVSDIIIDGEAPDDSPVDMDSWAACVAGALPEGEYIAKLRAAGFDHVEVLAKSCWGEGNKASATVKATKSASQS